jgi:hypothetical protein
VEVARIPFGPSSLSIGLSFQPNDQAVTIFRKQVVSSDHSFVSMTGWEHSFANFLAKGGEKNGCASHNCSISFSSIVLCTYYYMNRCGGIVEK